MTPGALLTRGTMTCPGGLAGKTFRVDGLEATLTDVLVRVHHADGRAGDASSPSGLRLRHVRAAATTGQRAAAYLRIGIEHILLGVDHLLFVLGLLLIVARPLDAAQDDHLVHAGAQPDARDRHARLRERALLRR